MKKLLAAVLVMLMVISVIPMSAMAASVEVDLSKSSTDYYSIVEKNDYVLASGATETELVLNNAEGTHRNVVRAVEVDLTNPNISVMPTYKNISEDIDLNDEANWSTQIMSEQVKHLEDDLGLNVVSAMNVSLSFAFDHPFGLLIYKGKVLYDDRDAINEETGAPLYSAVGSDGRPTNAILVIKKDGTAEFRDLHAELTGDEWMAQIVCMGWLVKDGVSLYTTEDHTTANQLAPRSVIGIKADGSLVLMQNDGRQAPYSSGFTPYEMAQMMLSLGCVQVVNCDGGGTSTYLSKRAGETKCTLKSRPSDGQERATISGIAVISNAVSDGIFESAVLSTDTHAVTPGTKVEISVVGADCAGVPTDLPEDLTLELADADFGTIDADGNFVAGNKIGDAVINAVSNGKIVGSTTISIIAPDSLKFIRDSVEITTLDVRAGKTVKLPVTGFFGNKPITLNEEDVTLSVADATDGAIDGFTFTPNAEYAGGKEVKVTATLNADPSKTATISLFVYALNEIDFDFDNADNSNYVERITETNTTETTVSWCTKCNKEAGITCKLLHRKNLEDRTTTKTETTVIQEGVVKSAAWNRDVSNTTKNKETSTYQVTKDPKTGEFVFDYTFGIDIAKVDLPSGTDTILGLVDDAGSYENAFDCMCSLAPRVTTDSTVTAYLQFDKNVELIVDDLFIVSDFFELKDVSVDADNKMTLVASWKVQYSPIDSTTVNSVVVIGGLKGKIKDLDRNQTYTLNTSGSMSYHICMLTSTGYSYAWMLSGMGGGAYEKSPGAQSGQDSTQGIYLDKDNVISYADKFYMNTAWKAEVWENGQYYFDNAVVTDGLYYAPDKDGSDAWYYYNFVDGVATLYNGRLEHEGKLVDVVNGEVVPLNDTWIDDSYYVNGEKVTGVYYALEKGVENATDRFCYEFDKKGNLEGKYTGLYNDNGTYRYSYLGKFASGWQMIDNEWYYFDAETLAAQVGEKKFFGVVTYTFEETGRLADGEWVNTDFGYRYYYGPDCYKDCFAEIDGETYYFYDSYKYEKGFHCIRGAVGNPIQCYEFGENGVLLGEYKGSGLINTAEGKFYLDNGVAQTGLYNIDGDYYYFNTSYGYAYVCRSYNVQILNGCEFTPGTYQFDENGVIVTKNGYFVENGTTYYYVNNVKAKNVLVQVGEDYYYFGVDGQPIKDRRYYAANSKCDLPAKDYYNFGADGKALQGLVDGKLYVNGQPAATGLHKVGDDYYYSESGSVIVDRRYYAAKTNCELAAKDYYYFGADGKALQGVVDGYLYLNGQRVKRGLAKIGDDYYYSESGKVIVDRRYYATISNCELPEKEYYFFGADGKALQGVVDGKLYINGQIAKRGLVKFGDDYYYSESGTVIVDRRYYATLSNCDLPAKEYYYFGADGKALQGVVDGYLYINGQMAATGLNKFGDDYYYSESGKVVVDKRYYAKSTHCDLAAEVYYNFGADGKMLQGVVDGKLYIDGQSAPTGLTKYGDDYYYSESGKVVTGKYYASKTNCDLAAGEYYYFGEDGKMLEGVVDGYYYENGQYIPTGLTKIGDDYYYIESGKVATGKYYAKVSNCDLAAGEYYYFGEDGKMLEGVVDGYLYINGQKAPTGLTKYGDDYYYSESGKVATGKYYAKVSNCELEAGKYYYFDVDGTFCDGVYAEEDGVYYYEAGKRVFAGLVKVGDDFYYAGEGGKCATDKKMLCRKSSCVLPVNREYTFGADGKIVK